MPFYSITLEEFLTLYGDVPEAKLMFDMPDNDAATGSSSGGGNDITDAEELCRRRQIKAALRSKRWKRRMQQVARKCGVCGQKGGDDPAATDNICQPEADSEDDEMEDDESVQGKDKKKRNKVGKAMRWLGQGMLKHFYFMSVAVESTGGVYTTTYHKAYDGTVTSSMDYCYLSSYACTTPRTTLVY